MTFSSAIFLPSKVANPFSSFHWCLKLPGLFSFLAQKGHGHDIFLPHPSPSMLWDQGSIILTLWSFVKTQIHIPSLPRCLPSHTHTHTHSSFLHILFQRSAAKGRETERWVSQWAINYKACQLYWWPCMQFSIHLPELECFFPSFPHSPSLHLLHG